MVDVLFKIISEALYCLDSHSCCLGSDSAIGGAEDTFGRLLDSIESRIVGCAVKNRIDKFFESAESDTARCTLSARTCVTQVQECCCEVYGTKTGLAGLYVSFDVLVKLLDGFLSQSCGDICKSAHKSSGIENFIA